MTASDSRYATSGLTDAAAMVPFQTYPLKAGQQESVCQLCHKALVGDRETVQAEILAHRITHLQRALDAAVAAQYE